MKMRRPGVLFLIAAAIAILAAIAHEVIGAPSVLTPLKKSDLPEGVVWLHHFSWHVGTVATLTMAALFLLAVWHPLGRVFALIATTMSVAFAILAVALATFGNPALWQSPAPYPWAVIALLGGVGVWIDATTDSRLSSNKKRNAVC
ncbi:MAG: hypothetical protein AAF438_00380 [Pseudomonadota bacterium]